MVFSVATNHFIRLGGGGGNGDLVPRCGPWNILSMSLPNQIRHFLQPLGFHNSADYVISSILNVLYYLREVVVGLWLPAVHVVQLDDNAGPPVVHPVAETQLYPTRSSEKECRRKVIPSTNRNIYMILCKTYSPNNWRYFG
jgi:hypothetical protein